MRMTFTLGLLGLALIGSAGRAAAGYEFQFTNSAGVSQAAFTVAETQTVTIGVYLVTNDTTPLPNLVSAGVGILNTNTGFANVVANTDIAGNLGGTQFNFQSRNANPGGGYDAFLREAKIPPGTGVAPGGDGRIFLGNFTFTGISAGSVTITATDTPGAGFNDIVDTTGNVYDGSMILDTATINVTAIPEPGTMVLGGLLASGLGGVYLRRRRAAVSA